MKLINRYKYILNKKNNDASEINDIELVESITEFLKIIMIQ